MKKLNKTEKKLLVVLITAILFLITTCNDKIEEKIFKRKSETTTGSSKYKVTKISDGDTINVVKDGKKYRIRLYGIDAPESQQSFGTQSKEALSNKLQNKEIELKIMDVDQYGRKVAIIFYNGENINEYMLKEGWAWWYEEYAKNEIIYQRLQYEAKKNKKGLWRKDNNIPPWEYRKQKKNKNSKN